MPNLALARVSRPRTCRSWYAALRRILAGLPVAGPLADTAGRRLPNPELPRNRPVAHAGLPQFEDKRGDLLREPRAAAARHGHPCRPRHITSRPPIPCEPCTRARDASSSGAGDTRPSSRRRGSDNPDNECHRRRPQQASVSRGDARRAVATRVQRRGLRRSWQALRESIEARPRDEDGAVLREPLEDVHRPIWGNPSVPRAEEERLVRSAWCALAAEFAEEVRHDGDGFAGAGRIPARGLVGLGLLLMGWSHTTHTPHTLCGLIDPGLSRLLDLSAVPPPQAGEEHRHLPPVSLDLFPRRPLLARELHLFEDLREAVPRQIDELLTVTEELLHAEAELLDSDLLELEERIGLDGLEDDRVLRFDFLLRDDSRDPLLDLPHIQAEQLGNEQDHARDVSLTEEDGPLRHAVEPRDEVGLVHPPLRPQSVPIAERLLALRTEPDRCGAEELPERDAVITHGGPLRRFHLDDVGAARNGLPRLLAERDHDRAAVWDLDELALSLLAGLGELEVHRAPIVRGQEVRLDAGIVALRLVALVNPQEARPVLPRGLQRRHRRRSEPQSGAEVRHDFAASGLSRGDPAAFRDDMDRGADRPEQRGKMALRREERQDKAVRLACVDDAPEPILDVGERRPFRELGPILLVPSDGPLIEQARLPEDHANDLGRLVPFAVDRLDRLRLRESILHAERAIPLDDLERVLRALRERPANVHVSEESFASALVLVAFLRCPLGANHG